MTAELPIFVIIRDNKIRVNLCCYLPKGFKGLMTLQIDVYPGKSVYKFS